MNRRILIWSLLILPMAAAVDSSRAAAAANEDIAIVAHPSVPVQDLNMAEIRKIFMGDRQYWSPNLRITLLVRAPVARERDIVLKTIYQMSEAQFRQYWIGKVFRAESASGPKIVYSSGTATELVSGIPGCITFMLASEVPKTLKTVKVNGLLPGEKGYPLR